MSTKFKFELNSRGVVELMKSANMKKVLSNYGSSVSNKAGHGYSYSVQESGDRSKVFVHASTKKAKRDNLKNNTLLKALGSSKG